MNQKKNILRQAKEKILQLENCPKCGEKLVHKWLFRKDQEELKFESSDLTSDKEKPKKSKKVNNKKWIKV